MRVAPDRDMPADSRIGFTRRTPPDAPVAPVAPGPPIALAPSAPSAPGAPLAPARQVGRMRRVCYGRTPATSNGSRRQVVFGPAATHSDPWATTTAPPPSPVKLDGAIGPRIDADHRHAGCADPDRAGAGRNLTGTGGRGDRDRRDDLVARRVDARHAAVAAIERPHAAFANREPARPCANLDRLDRLVGVRVDPREPVAVFARHPERFLAGRDRDRRLRDVDFGDRRSWYRDRCRDRTPRRSVSTQRLPTFDAQTAIGAGSFEGHALPSPPRLQVEPRNDPLAAERDPHAAERDVERGARAECRPRSASPPCCSWRRSDTTPLLPSIGPQPSVRSGSAGASVTARTASGVSRASGDLRWRPRRSRGGGRCVLGHWCTAGRRPTTVPKRAPRPDPSCRPMSWHHT